MSKKSADYNVHLKKAAIMEHAAAVKRYSKAQSGFKTGHERAVKKAMSKMLRMETHGKT